MPSSGPGECAHRHRTDEILLLDVSTANIAEIQSRRSSSVPCIGGRVVIVNCRRQSWH